MEFQSIIKRTRKQKMQLLAAKFTIDLAKEYHDPRYEQYHMIRQKFIQLKKLLFMRYRREAYKRAKMSVKKSALAKLGIFKPSSNVRK